MGIFVMRIFIVLGLLGDAFAWPSKRDGNAYIAGQVKRCTLSDLSAKVCADQLVDSLEHHFGGNWGCMVTKPGYGSGFGYYYYWDGDNKYGVQCYPSSSSSVNRSDLIYMCRNAEHACVGESDVPKCIRDFLMKNFLPQHIGPTFCPTRYFTLLVAPSDQDTAFDHSTTNNGYTAKGGDQVSAAFLIFFSIPSRPDDECRLRVRRRVRRLRVQRCL